MGCVASKKRMQAGGKINGEKRGGCGQKRGGGGKKVKNSEKK
jgi:hypothetical protein